MKIIGSEKIFEEASFAVIQWLRFVTTNASSPREYNPGKRLDGFFEHTQPQLGNRSPPSSNQVP
jgi:hypothetical protein